jgi:type II secretory pathway pseudopilin PulG
MNKFYKKSFTLIEILIATGIFVIVLGVAMATIWSVMRPKAKTQTLSNLQESTRLAMETISENLKKANTGETGQTYLNFAIGGSGQGTADPFIVPESGNTIVSGKTLRVVSRIAGHSGSYPVLRVFRIYKGSKALANNQTSCLPDSTSSGGCVLKMTTVINNDYAHPVEVALSSPDVDITNIVFKGHYWTTDTTTQKLAPYVEITIDAKNRYDTSTQRDVTEKGTLTLKTTVSPVYTFARPSGPLGIVHLFYDDDNNPATEMKDMGEFLDFTVDALGEYPHFANGGLQWTTDKKNSNPANPSNYKRISPIILGNAWTFFNNTDEQNFLNALRRYELRVLDRRGNYLGTVYLYRGSSRVGKFLGNSIGPSLDSGSSSNLYPHYSLMRSNAAIRRILASGGSTQWNGAYAAYVALRFLMITDRYQIKVYNLTTDQDYGVIKIFNGTRNLGEYLFSSREWYQLRVGHDATCTISYGTIDRAGGPSPVLFYKEYTEHNVIDPNVPTLTQQCLDGERNLNIRMGI